MASMKTWFERFHAVTDEWPHTIRFVRENYGQNEFAPFVTNGMLVPFDLSDPIMRINFDDGFGTQHSPTLCAWSKTWVIFTHEYDGAESIEWRPREPTALPSS